MYLHEYFIYISLLQPQLRRIEPSGYLDKALRLLRQSVTGVDHFYFVILPVVLGAIILFIRRHR